MGKLNIDSLRIIPCLSRLRREELDLIANKSELLHYSKGTMVFAQSDPIEFIFIVEKGLLKAYKNSLEGRELIIGFFEPGDHFCFPIHKVKSRHLVNTIALKDSTLIVIPIEYFDNFLKSALSEEGYRIILGLCTKIHLLSDIIEDMAFKNVEQRVIKALLKVAEEQKSDTHHIKIEITHQNIASMTGTVREVVSRTMSKLKKKGIILESDVHGFTINTQKLRDLHDFFL